jgi:ABC-2 type transport system ATP-binding protein
MISLSHITKTYNKGTIHAVTDFSLEVNKGEIFGLIGPDGSGKTTLFRLLTTLLIADSGIANVNGWDVVKEYKKIRNSVGYMPGRFSLYQDLSVEENLNLFATIFDTTIEKNYHLIKDIYEQIEPFKDRRAGKLSGGMKQKLALCCAMIHKPIVLFLDEPTTGVDSVSRKEFWEMLKKLKQQGITIMVSTPYMDEVILCDRIALVRNGSILAIDTPEKIRSSFPSQLYAVKTPHTFKAMNDLRNFEQTESCLAFGDAIHVTFKKPLDEKLIAEFLQSTGNTDFSLEKIAPTIEDSFIQMLKDS